MGTMCHSISGSLSGHNNNDENDEKETNNNNNDNDNYEHDWDVTWERRSNSQIGPLTNHTTIT